jgi:hypothetical protein
VEDNMVYDLSQIETRDLRPCDWLISALLSIPILLIIALLSPLDAYATAKTIPKQI